MAALVPRATPDNVATGAIREALACRVKKGTGAILVHPVALAPRATQATPAPRATLARAQTTTRSTQLALTA